MQNEMAVQGAHAFMLHIYTHIYIKHGAWAIVCYTILQAVQSFMSVNTNSPHAPFFMCQPINNLQQKPSGDLRLNYYF